MASGPVCAMVWQGRDVVKQGRAMLGATNPLASAPGTIRGDYAIVRIISPPELNCHRSKWATLSRMSDAISATDQMKSAMRRKRSSCGSLMASCNGNTASQAGFMRRNRTLEAEWSVNQNATPSTTTLGRLWRAQRLVTEAKRAVSNFWEADLLRGLNVPKFCS